MPAIHSVHLLQKPQIKVAARRANHFYAVPEIRWHSPISVTRWNCSVHSPKATGEVTQELCNSRFVLGVKPVGRARQGYIYKWFLPIATLEANLSQK